MREMAPIGEMAPGCTKKYNKEILKSPFAPGAISRMITVTCASNRRKTGTVDRLGWGGDAVGCRGARFCSNACMCRVRGVLPRREAVTALERYEDNTSLDDCADQRHGEDLFDGQRVGFHKLLRSHLIRAGRVPGMGPLSVSFRKPVTR